MNNLAKLFIVAGLFLILIGLMILILFRLKIPFLGRLPGDIFIQKKNFAFYFPLTTCLLISLILSIIVYFFFKR